jgi:hypothetical protein
VLFEDRRLSGDQGRVPVHQATFRSSAAAASVSKACALLAWLAAVKIAFLSFFNTFNQEAI